MFRIICLISTLSLFSALNFWGMAHPTSKAACSSDPKSTLAATTSSVEQPSISFDLVPCIGTYASISSLRRLSLTARHWMTAVEGDPHARGRLVEQETEKFIEPLAGSPAFWEKYVTGCCSLRQRTAFHLRPFPATHALAVAERVFALLPLSLPRLARLTISDVPVGNAAVGPLLQLQSLVEIVLRSCPVIADQVYRTIASIPTLRSLCVEQAGGLTNEGLRHFEKCSTLRHLTLVGCPSLTEIRLDVGALSALHRLALRRVNIDVATVLGLHCCRRLTELQLEGVNALCDATAEGALRGLHKLTALSLRRCSAALTDRGLSHVSQLSALTKLELRSCDGITDAALLGLSAAHRLVSLSLLLCKQIDGSGFVHLAALKFLEKLDLRGLTLLRDSGVSHLQFISSLRRLRFQGATCLSDASLSVIAPMPLEELFLISCAGVTDAGVALLAGSTSLKLLDLRGCRITSRVCCQLTAAIDGLKLLSMPCR